MIELTEVLYRGPIVADRPVRPEFDEEPVLINRRHIVTARSARCRPYILCEDKVYRITLITGEVLFVISGMIDDDPEDWARALTEAA